MTQKTTPEKRVRRASINGTRQVLTVKGKDPAFEYRIVNDEGDRVGLMEERGYEIVRDDSIKVGDRRIVNPSQQGSPVQVSVGGGLKGILMRIPKEFYEEDQKAKQEQVNELESQMKREVKNNADYGKFQVS